MKANDEEIFEALDGVIEMITDARAKLAQACRQGEVDVAVPICVHLLGLTLVMQETIHSMLREITDEEEEPTWQKN